MDTRTVGALALRPTDNAQGGYYFYSLVSGKRLYRTYWMALPMPDAVKDRVHKLARRANADKGLTFTDSDGRDLDAIFPDDNDDGSGGSDYDPAADEQSYDSDEDSNYEPSDTDSNASDEDADAGRIHVPIVPPAGDANDRHNAGVDDADDASSASDEEDDADASSASDEEDDADEEIEADDAGVNDDENSEPTGVEDLEEFVEGLEAELDDKIANLDSNYDPNDSQSSGDDVLEGNFGEINQDEIDGMRADATNEQDDAQMPRLGRSRQHDDESASDSDDEQDEAPLPRLRRNRQPDYAHLKGRDGNGLLPTVARPHEFHHAHLILEHIVMTQYNMKQGIKKARSKPC
jgi:hypothetical protein